MRAARRILVLAGILAMAVFAPITWSQAGAQATNGEGDASPSTITFVKIMCADFGAIPANVNTPDDLTPRPPGTHLGPSSGVLAVGDESAPQGCERVDGWPFVLGSDADLVSASAGGGRRVDPSLPQVTGTITLSSEQAALLDGRNLRASEVEQPGFAFGTIRCGTDNTNGDNLEFLGSGDPLICVAYNVGAPVTIKKTVEGSVPTTPEGGFAFDIRCGGGESTTFNQSLRLEDGASKTLWLPYGTDCSLAETEAGGADTVSYAVNGEAADTSEASDEAPTLEFTTPDIVENEVAPTKIDVTNSGFSADLALTKKANPTTVAQGSPVSFDLTVKNNGPDDATGVVLTDELPTPVTWTIVNAPESLCAIQTDGESGVETLQCDFGGLANGSSVAVTVRSSNTTKCGTITNEDAAVTADTPDADSENNLASASAGVTCPPTPGIINDPVPDSTTTTSTTTTTTTIKAREAPAPQPEIPPTPTEAPPPTVLATVVVRTFIPPAIPPPSEPPPVVVIHTAPPRATPPPPEVVLRTVNPSATPGGVLGVTGEGCTPNAKVEFSIDGKVVGEATADADGKFQSDVNLPVLDIGRSVLHADCGGSTDTNFDVVLTTSSMPAGSLGMGVLFLAILAVIAFAHPLAASKKG